MSSMADLPFAGPFKSAGNTSMWISEPQLGQNFLLDGPVRGNMSRLEQFPQSSTKVFNYFLTTLVSQMMSCSPFFSSSNAAIR